MTLAIRRPKADEAAALTDLCLRSKASWGYDDAFMKASQEALTVTPERMAADAYWVAEKGGRLVGVAAVIGTGNERELDLLFVEPDLKRAGIGQALLDHAVSELRRDGLRRLNILADPYAENFYLRYGATRIGEVPSDAIPGRLLPLFALDV